MYISLHRHELGRFYPGTGAADEVTYYSLLNIAYIIINFIYFYVLCLQIQFLFVHFGLQSTKKLVALECVFYHESIITYKDYLLLQVGTMGAEGYCVNVPWSQSGVGDNDYNFAFKQVVLPIGYFHYSFLIPKKKKEVIPIADICFIYCQNVFC